MVKYLLSLICCFAAQAQFGQNSAFLSYAPSTLTLLVSENCEGTGTPSFWSDVVPPDWDFSTAGIGMEGSQCVELAASEDTYYEFTNQTNVTVYFRWRMSAAPSATGYFIQMAANGSSTYNYSFYWNTSRTISSNIGGTSDATIAQDAATTFYCKVRFQKGSGANAWASVEFTSDGVFDDVDDDNYAICTDGNKTTDIGRIHLNPGAGTGTVYFDDIRVYAGWLDN